MSPERFVKGESERTFVNLSFCFYTKGRGFEDLPPIRQIYHFG
jgi:hypothetical protein